MKHFVLVFLTAIGALAAPSPILGVLRHGQALELSVVYDQPVDASSLQALDSYVISSGALASSRLAATNQGVVLVANGVTPNVGGTLTITGVVDTASAELPQETLPFTWPARFWAGIGANELGLAEQVTTIGSSGYDLFNGGIQQKDEYDEATFAGQQLTGDFDVKVRVDFLEPAGQNAKAGIMVRERMDEGKARPFDPENPAEAFGRYLMLSIAAPTAALGFAGHQEHQVWQRQRSPSISTERVDVTNDAPPVFPNAWLRLKRVGQMFTLSRGVDGLAWVDLVSTQFPEAFPSDAFVGISFSAENNDLPPDSGLRKSFVAKFRDLDIREGAVGSDRITIRPVGDHAEVSWDGAWILETATAVTGAWGTAASQANPQTVTFDGAARFFRLRR